jgi:hypothetical protein
MALLINVFVDFKNMKKIIFIVAILISLVILFFIIADLVNSQVSYKYEIDDPIVGDYIDKEFVSGYLIGKIRWLKFFYTM